jgi:hypothetical protein
MGGMPARWLSIVTSAVVVLGLVGMHHLVVAACHHGGTLGDQGAVLSMDLATGHGAHGHGDAVPAGTSLSDMPLDGSDGIPGGIVGAAATCLAILLMVVGLVLPQILARLRRWRSMRLSAAESPMAALTPKPPDLTLLSVSRT